jgi:predicted nucleic acid-binding protein
MAWMRHNRRVQARCLQHQNELRVAAPTIMELARWLLRPGVSIRHQLVYQTLMQHVQTLAFDRNIAEGAALVASRSSTAGVRLAALEAMVVATALEAGSTLVTHDTRRYAHISGLMLADWMVP